MFLFPRAPPKRPRECRAKCTSDYTEVADCKGPFVFPSSPHSHPRHHSSRTVTPAGRGQVNPRWGGRGRDGPRREKRVQGMNESCLSHTTCSSRRVPPRAASRIPGPSGPRFAARAARWPRSRPGCSSLRSRRGKGGREEAGASGPSPEPRPPKPAVRDSADRDGRATGGETRERAPPGSTAEAGSPAGWPGARPPARPGLGSDRPGSQRDAPRRPPAASDSPRSA